MACAPSCHDALQLAQACTLGVWARTCLQAIQHHLTCADTRGHASASPSPSSIIEALTQAGGQADGHSTDAVSPNLRASLCLVPLQVMSTPAAYAYLKGLLSHLQQATDVLHVKGCVYVCCAGAHCRMMSVCPSAPLSIPCWRIGQFRGRVCVCVCVRCAGAHCRMMSVCPSALPSISWRQIGLFQGCIFVRAP